MRFAEINNFCHIFYVTTQNNDVGNYDDCFDYIETAIEFMSDKEDARLYAEIAVKRTCKVELA